MCSPPRLPDWYTRSGYCTFHLLISAPKRSLTAVLDELPGHLSQTPAVTSTHIPRSEGCVHGGGMCYNDGIVYLAR